MVQQCEQIQELMSGYLDGEFHPEDASGVERHVQVCAACRQEFEKMKRLVRATSGLEVDPPPEEVWDTFLESVYNRLERRTGWTIFILGSVALVAFGAYHFIVDPWASATIKTIVATPVVGLGILFVSVLRQRRFVARTDRYSREVRR